MPGRRLDHPTEIITVNANRYRVGKTQNIVVEITDDSNEGHRAAYNQNQAPEKAVRLDMDWRNQVSSSGKKISR
jgi:hypothetical protein